MNIRNTVFTMAALAGVVMSLLAGTATASTQNGGWTHLGGDPLVMGGINSRADFVQLITSSKGATAMRYAGMTSSEIRAVRLAARMGQFRSCRLKYGMHFVRMSFGINGTSVDQNVTFLDPHYKGSGAAAYCADVRVGNKVLHLLVPRKCANISVINRTKVKTPPKAPKPKVPTPKPVPKPTPPPTGSCNAINSPGAVVCSSFYVIVTCGGVQINIQGDTAQHAIDNAKAYSDSHDCNTVVITTPPTPPPPPPTPVCPAGTTGTPPNCVTPPVAPSCSNVTSPQNGPNGVYADGETYPGHVTITSKSGESLAVTFSSSYGSFTNGPISFTSNGVDVKDWVYKAPNDAAVVGKSDQIMVTVTNTKTGLSGTCHSDPFILNASPPQV